MKPKITSSESAMFGERLLATLAELGLKPIATELARTFNSRSTDKPISTHCFRKWLKGESIPTQPSICVLSAWLQVTPEWLRYGDKEAPLRAVDRRIDKVSRELYSIVSDYKLLNDHSRQLFDQMVAHMLALQQKKSGPAPDRFSSLGRHRLKSNQT